MDFVKIRGFLSTDSTPIASEIRIEQNIDDDKIEAPINNIPGNGASSLSLLGILFTTNNMTEFENEDNTIPSSAFYSQLQPGRVIGIKDNNPHDGIANKAEIEK